MGKNNKHLVWAIPLLLIATGMLFWKPLAGWALQKHIANVCASRIEGAFSVADCSIDSTHIVLKQPCVECRGFSATVDEVTIAYIPHWFQRTLSVDVKAESMKISAEAGVNLSQIFRNLLADSLLKPKGTVTVNNGRLRLDEGASAKTVYFNTSFDIDLQEHTALQLAFNNDAFVENAMEVVVDNKEDDGTRVDLNFRNVNCCEASRVMVNLFPQLEGWPIERGTANGKLTVIRKKGRRPHVEGYVVMRGLLVNSRSLDATAQIDEAVLKLYGDHAVEKKTIGELTFTKGAALRFHRGSDAYWDISQVTGGVRFDRHDAAYLLFEGECGQHDRRFAVRVDGDIRLFDSSKSFLDVGVALTSTEGNVATGRCSLRQMGSVWNCAEVSFSNVTHAEFQFIQDALARHSKKWNDLQFYHGTFDIAATAYLKGAEVHDLKIQKLIARNIAVELPSIGVYTSAAQVNGELNIDFSADDCLSTLEGELAIDQGELHLAGFGDDLWKLTNIDTNLHVLRGSLQKSLLKGQFSGLFGTIEVDFTTPSRLMTMNFSGAARNLMRFIPDEYRPNVEKEFLHDAVTLKIEAAKHAGGLALEGTLLFDNMLACTSERINFDCIVKKRMQNLWGADANFRSSASPWQKLSIDSIDAILPDHVVPSWTLAKDWSRRQRGISGFIIIDGHLRADDVPLEKYVAPFVFSDGKIAMKGRGFFTGVFDHQSLAIAYDARDIIMEGEGFLMDVSSINPDVDGTPAYLATHYFDFGLHAHHGRIPIPSGCYYDKQNGLLFTNFSTEIFLEGDWIFARGLETFCNGVQFYGDVDIDCAELDQDRLDIAIHIDTMDGTVSDLQRLFNHFDEPPAFVKVPLEGKVTLRKGGAQLEIHVDGQTVEMVASAEGSLQDGAMRWEGIDAAISDLSLDYTYRGIEDTLELKDIQAMVLVGKPDHVEEYILAGERVFFSDCANDKSTFDLWIGDKNRDLIRFAGKTQGFVDVDDISYVDVELDQSLTHIGNVHPSAFSLALKEWSEVLFFRLDVDITLSTILHDVQRISRSGLFFLAPSLVSELNKLQTATGDFHLSLGYDEEISEFNFSVVGHDVAMGSYRYNEVFFNGKQRGEVWSIEQLQLDDLAFSAEAQRLASRWKLNFLGIRCGDALLVGLDGEFDDHDEAFSAHIKRFDLDLTKLNQWEAMRDFVDEKQPTGKLSGTGKLRFELVQDDDPWRIDLSLNASLRDWGIQGLRFSDADNFSCHFVSSVGTTLRNLQCDLVSGDGNGAKAQISLDKMSYDRRSQEMQLNGLHFDAAVDALTWISDRLGKAFPEIIEKRSVDIMTSLKREGRVTGTVDLVLPEKGAHTFSLALNDGSYYLFDKEYAVQNFSMTHTPDSFRVMTQYRYNQALPWVEIYSKSPDFVQGTASVFADENHEEKMMIKWHVIDGYGIAVDEVSGGAFGINLALVPDESRPIHRDFIYLTGNIDLVLPKAYSLFDADVADQWRQQNISGSYSLKGKIVLDKDCDEHRNRSRFSGHVEGKNCSLKSYQFDGIAAELDYSEALVNFRHVAVHDAAGEAAAEIITLARQGDDWLISMPSFTVTNLRPSVLCEAGADRPTTATPLLVRRIDLEKFEGRLSDSNTYAGVGTLQFANTTRSAKNILFAIPQEIINRIGLNMAALNPVSGTIQYELGNGKIFLKNFKDVFSEGHLSKFYIADKGKPSYIDYDGNLNLRIGMKQYNILLKLAELFTVKVRGHYTKPSYHLKKQDKK